MLRFVFDDRRTACSGSMAVFTGIIIRRANMLSVGVGCRQSLMAGATGCDLAAKPVGEVGGQAVLGRQL